MTEYPVIKKIGEVLKEEELRKRKIKIQNEIKQKEEERQLNEKLLKQQRDEEKKVMNDLVKCIENTSNTPGEHKCKINGHISEEDRQNLLNNAFNVQRNGYGYSDHHRRLGKKVIVKWTIPE